MEELKLNSSKINAASHWCLCGGCPCRCIPNGMLPYQIAYEVRFHKGAQKNLHS